MNRIQLSPQRLELLVGFLATFLIAAGLMLYASAEPTRLTQAQAAQLDEDLQTAMTLYAENCSVCHGLAGEGIGATPALNSPALRESDPLALEKIIARGLYATAMPAWSLEDGGPLGDYAISTLVALIQSGDWSAVQERVVNLGLAPRVPFTTEPDPAILAALAGLPGGDQLTLGIQLYSEQCVACHGADGAGTRLAPALNDPSIRLKSPDELQRTILNGVPGTLMAGWNKTLAGEELQALLTLLARWDEIPAGAIPAPDKPFPVTAESLAAGAQLFAANCSGCHGPEGQGTQRAPSLNVKAFLADTHDQAMQQIITSGVPNTSMPAWGDRLAEAEIQAVVGFIRSWEPTAPEVAQPARVRGPWWRSNTATGNTLPSGGSQASPQGAPAAGDQTGGGNQAGSQASAGHGAGNQPGGGQGAGNQAGGGHGAGNQPGAQTGGNWLETIDWRVAALASGIVLVAGTFVLAGLTGLRRLASDRAENQPVP